jgi:protein SCO1/2
MSRLQALTKKESLQADVMFLSHTVDPVHDLPDTLKKYGTDLGADFSNWNFVTGSAEEIYWQAENGYMLTAFPSDSAEGGFFHTDKIALIDREMHIRGLYDGTSTKEVDKLFEDLKLLVKEKK